MMTTTDDTLYQNEESDNLLTPVSELRYWKLAKQASKKFEDGETKISYYFKEW